jgi:glycosyltransferase involved in cell wall biosynthesis
LVTETRRQGPEAGGESPALSIILPTYNLKDAIAHTITALRQELRPVAPRLELIVVDDGSSDGTARVVADLAREASDVRLLCNRRNLGKGLSVYLGVLAARYDNVCFTDADLAFLPGSYRQVAERLLAGAPLVVASRRMPDSEILVRMEFLGYAARRHLIGLLFNLLVRTSLRLPFRDTQCGLKGFDRALGIDLLRRMRSPRFLFDIELLLAARRAQIAVAEVPVCMVYKDLKSSVRLLRDAARTLWDFGLICGRDWSRRYGTFNPSMDPDQLSGCTEEIALPVEAY